MIAGHRFIVLGGSHCERHGGAASGSGGVPNRDQRRRLMTDPDPSRRRLLAGLVLVLNGLAAALVATPAIGYLLSPLFKRTSGQWVAIGRTSAFEGPGPHQVRYEYRDEGGYTIEQKRWAAFVVRVGDEVIVLSPVCTHMGCNVAVNDAKTTFECPCHGGQYDATGQVTDGPPPRPLRRFQTRLRDGILEILVT